MLTFEKVINFVVTLRTDVFKDMPLQQIRTLLLVSQNEGITEPEIADRLNLSQGAVSRNVTELAKEATQIGRKSYNLLSKTSDANDKKRVAVKLTEKGRALTADDGAELLTFFDKIGDEIYEETPLSQIYLYLSVSQNEGILQKEIKEKLGMSQSSVSKNVKTLSQSGPVPTSKQKHYELLEVKYNEKGYKAIYLTDRGRHILSCAATDQQLVSDISTDIESLSIEEDHFEGNPTKRYSNYYERDPKIRLKAIRHHKVICKACGFDFEKIYGARGKNYIEVHHNKPLSHVKRSIKIDIANDLTVLCSNCHRMIHRRQDDVLSLSDLQAIIEKAKTGAKLGECLKPLRDS